MSKLTCEARDIFCLNETKEYTLTATALLNIVLTDPSLKAQSAKLWQLLFSLARFDKDLSIKIPYSELAKSMGVSSRTIIRYIKTLVDNGYLKIKNNFADGYGQLSNTLFVRFPKDKIEIAYKSKDRNKQNLSNQSSFDPSDKIDAGAGDRFVTHNNTNKNNTNKTTVVKILKTKANKCKHLNNDAKLHVEHNELSIEKRRKRLESAKSKLSERKRLFRSTSCKEELASLFDEYHKLDTWINLETQTLDAIEHKLKKEVYTQTLINKANSDFKLIHLHPGNRALNNNEFYRLKSGLTKIKGVSFNNLPKLLNEIMYSIRFGDLVRKQSSKETLSINHAINIALKLVREKRWESPKEFMQFLENSNE